MNINLLRRSSRIIRSCCKLVDLSKHSKCYTRSSHKQLAGHHLRIDDRLRKPSIQSSIQLYELKGGSLWNQILGRQALFTEKSGSLLRLSQITQIGLLNISVVRQLRF